MDATSCRRNRWADNQTMKLMMLLSVAATLLLAACASYSRNGEIVTETPSHDTVVRDEIPAEGSRKIPVIQQY
jgi:uncharacterized lipoprotein YajG